MHPLATGTAHHKALAALGTALLCSAGLATPPPPQPTSAKPPPPPLRRARTPNPLLNNGLARTPPMGFNNWNSTHGGPYLNEAMVKGTADLFVSKGLKVAGYR
ncbi:hypothetical protein [Streptomyces sp. RPT161]|uniref:hypothetical protein n=1 Tax=Streptomyces sp. RPT161 TaxID=3015993 RepID=UPI003FCD1923